MIARTLVAHGAVDQDEVWRRSNGGDLAGGCNADEQPTARRKKLFGNEHRERSADGATDDTNLSGAVEIKRKEFGVVASPALVGAAAAGLLMWRTTSPSGSSRQISGTATSGNCLWRRASRSSASGRNTDASV